MVLATGGFCASREQGVFRGWCGSCDGVPVGAPGVAIVVVGGLEDC